MNWNFLGFHNWPAMNGTLTMLQGFDVFRASESSQLPRDICEQCVCWRVWGTCRQVQVDDYDMDRRMRESYTPEELKELRNKCLCERNCCPILFFDFICIKLPVLETDMKGTI